MPTKGREPPHLRSGAIQWRKRRFSSAHMAQLQLDAFLGTFAPFLRASDNPMAIACFLLLTTPPFPPLPDRNVPRFRRRIALLTVLLAARPYLAMIASDLIKMPRTTTIATENLDRDRQLSVDLPPKTCRPRLAPSPNSNTCWLTRIYQDRCMLNPSRTIYKSKIVERHTSIGLAVQLRTATGTAPYQFRSKIVLST